MSLAEHHRSTIIFVMGIIFLASGLILAIYNVYLFGTANSGLSSAAWVPIATLIGALITAGITLVLHQSKGSKKEDDHKASKQISETDARPARLSDAGKSSKVEMKIMAIV